MQGLSTVPVNSAIINLLKPVGLRGLMIITLNKEITIMWWILQILGSLAVIVVLTYSRIVGLSWSSYSVYVFAQIAFIGWCFPVSYMKAPSFLQAWFIGNATLAMGGFIVSMVLKDAVSLTNVAGAILATIGSILLII